MAIGINSKAFSFAELFVSHSESLPVYPWIFLTCVCDLRIVTGQVRTLDVGTLGLDAKILMCRCWEHQRFHLFFFITDPREVQLF